MQAQQNKVAPRAEKRAINDNNHRCAAKNTQNVSNVINTVFTIQSYLSSHNMRLSGLSTLCEIINQYNRTGMPVRAWALNKTPGNGKYKTPVVRSRVELLVSHGYLEKVEISDLNVGFVPTRLGIEFVLGVSL